MFRLCLIVFHSTEKVLKACKLLQIAHATRLMASPNGLSPGEICHLNSSSTKDHQPGLGFEQASETLFLVPLEQKEAWREGKGQGGGGSASVTSKRTRETVWNT